MDKKQELLTEIQQLTARRNLLLEQIKDAEAWEGASWDSFNALTEYHRSTEKKRDIAQNYWNSSQSAISIQFDFVADQSNRVKKVLEEKRYDLLDKEVDELMKEVRNLADVLGIEIDELPLHFPFFDLPPKEEE